MFLSSRLSGDAWHWFLIDGVVAEHGPEDVDASPGEGDERLFVGLSLAALPVVVDPRGRAVLQAGEGGEVTGPEEPAVEATRPVQIPADAS